MRRYFLLALAVLVFAAALARPDRPQEEEEARTGVRIPGGGGRNDNKRHRGSGGKIEKKTHHPSKLPVRPPPRGKLNGDSRRKTPFS